MKRFTFTMAGVLKLRTYERQNAEQTFHEASHRRTDQERQLREARADLMRVVALNPEPGRADVSLLRRHGALREAARHQVARAEETLQQMTEHEAHARSRLVHCTRAEETLQHLHDQQKQSYRQEMQHAEMETLDEQATARFIRFQRS